MVKRSISRRLVPAAWCAAVVVAVFPLDVRALPRGLSERSDAVGGSEDALIPPPPAVTPAERRFGGPDSADYDENASTRELLEMARRQRAEGNYGKSEALYKAVLIRESNHIPALLELATIYEITSRLEYARGLLTRASTLKPYDTEIIERSAAIARKLGLVLQAEVDTLIARRAYELAIPKISILHTLQPENADLHFRRAICQLRLGRPEVALEDINRAIRLQRDGRYYDVRAEIETILLKRKVDPLILEIEALLEENSRTATDEALRLLSEVLQHDPDNTWAREKILALSEDEHQRTSRPWDRWNMPPIGTHIAETARRLGEASMIVLNVFYHHLNLLLVLFVLLLVFRSPITFMVLRGFSPRPLLSGRLSQFNIHEILTLINAHNQTGVLRIRAGKIKGDIYLESGEAYDCTGGDYQGQQALKMLLKNAQEGYFVFSKRKPSVRKTIDTPLSLILMDLPDRRKTPAAASGPKRPRSKMKELLDSKN